METSGFFTAKLTNGSYDRTYVAEQFAQYFARFISNGVFMNLSSNALMVEALPDEGMKVKLNSGEGFIKGYWYKNDDIIKKSITPADGVLKRIDTVVLRYCNEERTIVSDIVTGTPSNNPVMTEPVRNSDYYELVLAKINIPQGATNIKSEYIVDLRLDSNYCGSVAALVEQIDTTEYGAQLNNFIEAYIQRSEEKFAGWEQTFGEWFDELKQRLDENAVTHLQQQLDDTIVEFNSVKTEFQGLENSTSEKHDDLVKKFNSLGEKFSALSTSFEEVKKSVGDSKSKLAAAITAKNISTASDADFSTMIENIGKIKLGQGNAVEGQVLKNATFANADGVLRTGSMPDNSNNVIYTSQTSGCVKYNNGSAELLPKVNVENSSGVALPSGYYPRGISVTVPSFEYLTNPNKNGDASVINDWSNQIVSFATGFYRDGKHIKGSILDQPNFGYDDSPYDFSRDQDDSDLESQAEIFAKHGIIVGNDINDVNATLKLALKGNGILYRKGAAFSLYYDYLFKGEEAYDDFTYLTDKISSGKSFSFALMHKIGSISGDAAKGGTQVVTTKLKRIDMLIVHTFLSGASTPCTSVYAGPGFGYTNGQVVMYNNNASKFVNIDTDLSSFPSIRGLVCGISGGNVTLTYTTGCLVELIAIQYP